MRKLGLLSLFAAAYLSAPRSTPAQTALPRVGVSRAQPAFLSKTHGDLLSLPALSSSSHRPARSSVLLGVAIGAGSGALLGALWGKHVDKQQVCPASGPCGGRSNAGPYALVGAGVGSVVGGVVGWLARTR
jgi:hypothetical protein